MTSTYVKEEKVSDTPPVTAQSIQEALISTNKPSVSKINSDNSGLPNLKQNSSQILSQ